MCAPVALRLVGIVTPRVDAALAIAALRGQHDVVTRLQGSALGGDFARNHDRPGVARAMWFATLLDAAIHRKWIQMLEQLDAPRRIAHLYAELHTRLELVGRNVTRALRTPFTQFDMADMCGVSAIHANRAVGKLRELGIAEIRRGDLYTADWAETGNGRDFVMAMEKTHRLLEEANAPHPRTARTPSLPNARPHGPS